MTEDVFELDAPDDRPLLAEEAPNELLALLLVLVIALLILLTELTEEALPREDITFEETLLEMARPLLIEEAPNELLVLLLPLLLVLVFALLILLTELTEEALSREDITFEETLFEMADPLLIEEAPNELLALLLPLLLVLVSSLLILLKELTEEALSREEINFEETLFEKTGVAPLFAPLLPPPLPPQATSNTEMPNKTHFLAVSKTLFIIDIIQRLNEITDNKRTVGIPFTKRK